MSGQHAFLPPSGADAWRWCAAWPTMNAKYPDAGDQTKAAEGEAAHWVNVQPKPPAMGTRAPNGVVITDEMLEGGEVWAEAVARVTVNPAERNVERRLVGKPIHDSLNWGTPDYWDISVSPTGALLRVLDYKFGHEFVEVFENWQLINYVALVLDAIGVDGRADQRIAVEMTVVQPRSYHKDGAVRTWRVPKAADLRAHINQLRGAADKATGPNPLASVGPHCKHCPGRHACQALQSAALSAVDIASDAVPIELPPHAVGLELRALDRAAALLDARRTGLQEQALATIKRGERVPFYAVEQGSGRETWTRPIAEVVALGAAMGVELAKPGAVTPAQARKAGLDPAIVAAFAETPTGAIKLVADDGLKARKVFGL